MKRKPREWIVYIDHQDVRRSPIICLTKIENDRYGPWIKQTEGILVREVLPVRRKRKVRK